MYIRFKKNLMAVAIISLIGCDVPSSDNSNSRDLTQASKSELVGFYNKLSDSEVVDVFVQQNTPGCVSEFRQNGINGDLNKICQCFSKNIANGLGANDVRKALLPSHMVEQSEQDRINGKMLSLMQSAAQSC